LALVTFIAFLGTMLPPMPAEASTANALAPLTDGVGGTPTLGTTPPSPNSPKALATVDLSMGAATSSFPFQLPKARGDAQPSLGMSYSSANGVGAGGVGWALSGSSIVRHGISGMPTFVDEIFTNASALATDFRADEYLADGEPLVPICVVSGTSCSGALPTETFPTSVSGWAYFRKELDDGSRYFLAQSGGTWQVQTKSGHLLQYGDPLDTYTSSGTERLSSSAVYPGGPTNINTAYQWHLVRDADETGKNLVLYVYDTLQSLLPSGTTAPGTLYLTDIYDSFAIVGIEPLAPATISPTSAANHTHVSWALPSSSVGPLLSPLWETVPFARVSRVDVTAWKSTDRVLVRSYLMSYLWNDWGTQYYLSSIATNGQCGTTASPNDIAEPAAYTASCPTLTTTSYGYQGITGNSQTVLPALETSATSMPKPTGFLGASPNWALVDLNGDGLADLVDGPFATSVNNNTWTLQDFIIPSGPINFPVTFASSNPSGLQANMGDLYPGENELVYGDWLGNGQVDWLWMNINQSTGVASPEIYNVTGDGAMLAGQFAPTFQANTNWVSGRSADIDGDGLPDMTLVPITNNTSQYSSTFSVRDRAGVTYPFGNTTVQACATSAMDPTTYGSDAFRTLTDMDGDGLPDLVIMSKTANSSSFAVQVLTNRGNGEFGAPNTSCNSGNAVSAGAAEGPSSQTPVGGGLTTDALSASIVRFGDLNGDRLADFAVLSPHGLSICFRYNDAVSNLTWGCTSESAQTLGAPTGQTIDMTQSGLQMADLGAYGAKQVVYYTPYNAVQQVQAVPSFEIGLLTTVTTSESAQTQIAYSTVAALNAGNLPNPQWVATSVSWTNGLGGTQTAGGQREYQYSNPVYDGRNRVFVGFQNVWETDVGDDAYTGLAPGVVMRTTFATQNCSASSSVSCTGPAGDGFFRALRGLPVVVEQDAVDSVTNGTIGSSGPPIVTKWNQYALSEPYMGLDGRSVRQLPLNQQHTILWSAGESGVSTSLNYLGGSEAFLSVNLPATAQSTELRQEWDYDNFLNLTQTIDYGLVTNSDQIILQRNTWAPPTGDTTGWNLRLTEVDTGSVANLGAITGPLQAPIRTYKYSYYPDGQLETVIGVLSGTLPLPSPTGMTSRPAHQPSEQSSNGNVTLASLTYDSYGNLTQLSTTNGRCAGASYDTTFALLQTSSSIYRNGCGVNPLTTTTVYDSSIQMPTMVVPPSGQTSTMQYDNFGRITELAQTGESPPVTLVTYVDNAPVRQVQIQTLVQTTPSTTYANHYRYIDSFNDTIAVVDEATGATAPSPAWRVSGVHTRTLRGEIATMYRPFFLLGPWSAAFPADTYPYTGPTASFTYDPLARKLSALNFDGGLTTWAYDPAHLKVTIKDPEQNSAGTIIGQNVPAANVGGTHIGANRVVRTDGHGRVVETDKNLVNGPGGSSGTYVVSTTYQPTGEPTVITQTSPTLSTTRWMQYDTLGRLVLNVEPNTSTGFSATPGAAGVTGWTYAYNDGGQVVGTADARGCGENLFHDQVGRLLAVDYSPCVTPNGYTTPNLSTGDGTEAFYVYDTARLGLLTSVQDLASYTQYAYDINNRVGLVTKQIATPTGSQYLSQRYATNLFFQNFQYDGANRVTQESTGANASQLQVSNASDVTFQYTKLNQLEIIGSSYGALLADTVYNPSGTIYSRNYGDVTGTVAMMTYNNSDALTSYTLTRNGGFPSVGNGYAPPSGTAPTTLEQSLTSVVYKRDLVENPTATTDSATSSQWPVGVQPMSRKATYEDDYRLTSVQYSYGSAQSTDAFAYPPYAPEQADGLNTYPKSQSTANRVTSQLFTYDWLGNTSSMNEQANVFPDRAIGTVHNGTSTAGPNQLKSTQMGSNSSQTINAFYDNAGNTTLVAVDNPSGPVATTQYNYTWNEIGQLATATRTENGVPIVVDQYSYDARGQRVRQQQTNYTTGVTSNTIQVFDTLVLDKSQFELVAYVDTDATEQLTLPAGGTAKAHVIYNPEALNGGSNEVPSINDNLVHVYMDYPDPLGSSSFVVDHDTGELVERPSYLAYGGAESDYRTQRWNDFREDIRYTAHWDDAEVGLIYFGARFYAPQLSRWLSPDPLAIHDLGGDLNPYAFVGGSPLGSIDPVGLNGCGEGNLGNECVGGGQGQPGQNASGDIITLLGVAAVAGLVFIGTHAASAISQGIAQLTQGWPNLFGGGGGGPVAPPWSGNNALAGTVAVGVAGAALAVAAVALAPEAFTAAGLYTLAVQVGSFVTEMSLAEAGVVVGGGGAVASAVDEAAEGAGGIVRGINSLGGVVSGAENTAGGYVVTAQGSVRGADFAGAVNSGLMRGEPVNILSGVHGTPGGVMTPDPTLLQEDIQMFGDMEGVTIHDTSALSPSQLTEMLNGSGTTIGAFCNSEVCLAPYR
jgi:RHS repeat-associated protein